MTRSMKGTLPANRSPVIDILSFYTLFRKHGARLSCGKCHGTAGLSLSGNAIDLIVGHAEMSVKPLAGCLDKGHLTRRIGLCPLGEKEILLRSDEVGTIELEKGLPFAYFLSGKVNEEVFNF